MGVGVGVGVVCGVRARARARAWSPQVTYEKIESHEPPFSVRKYPESPPPVCSEHVAAST